VVLIILAEKLIVYFKRYNKIPKDYIRKLNNYELNINVTHKLSA